MSIDVPVEMLAHQSLGKDKVVGPKRVNDPSVVVYYSCSLSLRFATTSVMKEITQQLGNGTYGCVAPDFDQPSMKGPLGLEPQLAA